MMLSQFVLFLEGDSIGRLNMQERSFEVFMGECSVFLHIRGLWLAVLDIMYVLHMLHYYVFKFPIVQMMRLVVAVC